MLWLLLVIPALVAGQIPLMFDEPNFCPEFLEKSEACTCNSYSDGAAIECDGPGGPEVVERLKNTNANIRELIVKNADIIEVSMRFYCEKNTVKPLSKWTSRYWAEGAPIERCLL